MSILTLQGPALDEASAMRVAAQTGTRITHRGSYYRLEGSKAIGAAELCNLRDQAAFDINLRPEAFAPAAVALVLFDMDSTFIGIECIDEIADLLGIKPQVAEITESAMRGEIDFETSLTRRVALLTGLDAGMLERIYTERVRLNPGAETLLAGLRAKGIRVALVSGGFTFFTERLKARHRLDFTRANVLDIDAAGRLTGRVHAPIVGADAKAGFLRELCDTLQVPVTATVAVGDGANDLKMLAAAGLGVAYHAKAVVQERAGAVINYCGLEGVLGLLDIEQPTAPGVGPSSQDSYQH